MHILAASVDKFYLSFITLASNLGFNPFSFTLFVLLRISTRP